MWKISKRILLFLLTNVAVLAMISVVLFVLESVFGFHFFRGNTTSLFIFAAVVGFSGAFISLWMSKWIAKKTYDIEIIQESGLLNYDAKTQLVYTVVARISQDQNITMPEVGVYVSQDPNAFATGKNKNSALVAVSTGLLDTMTADEIQGVVGHEMAHVLNGDMVTMTLLQGVLNTFVVFLSRLLGDIIDKTFFANEEGESSGLGYMITSFVLEIVFSLFASIILMAFSRAREYKADIGSAQMVGKNQMIRALKRLQVVTNTQSTLDDGQLTAFKIAAPQKWSTLFSSHPDLQDRITALENEAI